MKQRVIAVLLVLLLLSVSFVTGVFAEPGSEDENTEPVATSGEAQEPPASEDPAPTESSEPVEPPTSEATEPETEPVSPTDPEEPSTEAPTEPDPEPEPQPEPANEGGRNRLTIRVETEAPLDQDLLFLIRGEGFTVHAVIPTGSKELTLAGLPAGTCTVALESGWNWQIELDAREAAQSISFTGSDEVRTLTFHPELGQSAWLNNYAGGDGR